VVPFTPEKGIFCYFLWGKKLRVFHWFFLFSCTSNLSANYVSFTFKIYPECYPSHLSSIFHLNSKHHHLLPALSPSLLKMDNSYPCCSKIHCLSAKEISHIPPHNKK
jgi:hypothetical protein